MKNIYSVIFIVTMFLALGCESSKPVDIGGTGNGSGAVNTPTQPVDTTSAKPKPPRSTYTVDPNSVTLPSIDNTQYKLKSAQLDIRGEEKSANMEASRTKADSKVQQNFFKVLDNIMAIVAQQRHLPYVPVTKGTIEGTTTVDEVTTFSEDGNGRLSYNTTLTLRFETEAILRGLYKSMNPTKDYTWNAFCRDVDYLVQIINK